MKENIKEKALDIAVPMIAKFEGCRLRAYQDSVRVWTIGYGHTKGVHSGRFGRKSKPTTCCASKLITSWITSFSTSMLRLMSTSLAALTSFAYNLGVGAMKRSTLLRKLNSGDKAGAAHEFYRWNKAGGHVLRGLTSRREAEAKEFMRKDQCSSPRIFHFCR